MAKKFMLHVGVHGMSSRPPARPLRQEEPGRRRLTLGRGQRLSCFHAQIPNKKFPVAKLLYLEGHF